MVCTFLLHQDVEHDRSVVVHTAKASLHQGKVYFLRLPTPEDARLWIQFATDARVVRTSTNLHT
jgi:hypothetical protein